MEVTPWSQIQRDRILGWILEAEGGYVNDPRDPGGETIYGISRRAHPDAWTNGRPSLAQAKDIYLEQYWKPMLLTQVVETAGTPVAHALMDGAVNQGVGWMTRALQILVNAQQDGIMGPETLRKLRATVYRDGQLELFRAIIRARRAQYEMIGGAFLRGWMNRLRHVEEQHGVFFAALGDDRRPSRRDDPAREAADRADLSEHRPAPGAQEPAVEENDTMGFFKRFLGSIFAPTPPAVRPLDPKDSAEEQLKDAAIGAAEQLAHQALQVYMKTAIEKIPSRDKQIQAVEVMVEYLNGYKKMLVAALLREDARRARIERELRGQ